MQRIREIKITTIKGKYKFINPITPILIKSNVLTLFEIFELMLSKIKEVFPVNIHKSKYYFLLLFHLKKDYNLYLLEWGYKI